MPKVPNQSTTASADSSTEKQPVAADAAVTRQANGEQLEEDVTAVAATPEPVGYVVRCHRDRGVWRAGRFWPPESTPVPAEDLTKDQLEALRAEPLLSVLPVQ